MSDDTRCRVLADSTQKRTTASKKAPGKSNIPPNSVSQVVRSFLQVEPVTEIFASTLNWDFPNSKCTLHISGKQFHLNPEWMNSDSQVSLSTSTHWKCIRKLMSKVCPDSGCPAICFSFNTKQESSLAENLRRHFGGKFMA